MKLRTLLLFNLGVSVLYMFLLSLFRNYIIKAIGFNSWFLISFLLLFIFVLLSLMVNTTILIVLIPILRKLKINLNEEEL